jgi:hypothetical protein
VRRWLNLAGIDWRKARAARIVKHRERTFAILQGKPATQEADERRSNAPLPNVLKRLGTQGIPDYLHFSFV